MTTDMPLVTIGLTCFNAEDTIGRAIESAIAQDWPRLEVIVVDDCSTDSSVAVIQSAVETDHRVTGVFRETNGGPGAARATILSRAKGEFVAFFDDDDVSAPERVRIQVDRIVAYEKEVGSKFLACYASGERLYPNGYTLPIRAIGSEPIIPSGEAVADYLLFYGKKDGLFYGAGTPTCALMARRQTLIDVGGFDPEFRRVEDIDFAVRLALSGGHFIGCEEALYTQYATQGSDKSAQKNYQAEVQLLAKHRAFLESRGRYRYACNWFRFRYQYFSGNRLMALWVLMRAWFAHPVLVTKHLINTGPRRYLHERKMSK